MWSLIIPLILAGIIAYNLIRVMIYGRGIIKPDFNRVDEIFSEKTGFPSTWNTTFGKCVYYIFLTALIGLILMIIF